MPYIEPQIDIWSAARQGLLSELQRFVSEGVDLNSPNRAQVTPLHEAAEAGQFQVAKWLLENTANPNINTIPNRGEPGSYTPLHLAAQAGHIEMVKLLLQHGANMNAKMSDGCTALIIASEDGRLSLVKLLIESGADVNQVGQMGINAFAAALFGDYLDVARFLHQSGADPNHGLGAFEATPLMQAAGSKMFEAVRFLLELGVDVAVRDLQGKTVLHYSIFASAVNVREWSSHDKIRTEVDPKNWTRG